MTQVFTKMAVTVGVLLAVTAHPLNAQGEPPNGRNVRVVTYVNEQDRQGSFVEDGPHLWRQDTAAGERFRWQEVKRDDRSVYLCDDSQRVEIELDIAGRRIVNMAAKGPGQASYKIQAASTRMLGRIVHEVNYRSEDGRAAGRFLEVSEGVWWQRASGGDLAAYRFLETGRDDWSVYLVDDARGIHLQLDLQKAVIYLCDKNHSRQALYGIEGAF